MYIFVYLSVACWLKLLVCEGTKCLNASWTRVHLPEVVIAARMEEKPDLLYDLSGRQGLLKQLILCGQRPCAERLAVTSSLWMLSYTLMILTAALHVLQVVEEAVEAEISLCGLCGVCGVVRICGLSALASSACPRPGRHHADFQPRRSLPRRPPP